MTRIVFAGPTLHGSPPATFSSLVLRAPAACGDLARAVDEGATAIGLIDGRFETVPSVWHKEILWVLSKGVPVLGASSMGALRAAEMHPFGMRGVGTVYRLYRSGALGDDDEVAVLHGPPEIGAHPLSEAMVNMRATLRTARRRGVISPATEREMSAVAKALFYKERTWQRVFELCGRRAELRTDARALHERLGELKRDVKREDALLLLSRLRAIDTASRADAVGFPATVFWQAFEAAHLRGGPPAST